MSVNQSDIIDVISTNLQDQVILSISDHHSWDETWHLPLLQEKINAYLRFIESGQVFIDHPQAIGKDLIIRIAMKYKPNDDAIFFLTEAQKIVSTAGVELKWDILDFQSSDD